jgi:hypothetical protein
MIKQIAQSDKLIENMSLLLIYISCHVMSLKWQPLWLLTGTAPTPLVIWLRATTCICIYTYLRICISVFGVELVDSNEWIGLEME